MSATFVALIVVSSLGWYIYTSSSAPFISLVGIADHIYESLSEIFNPETRDPAVLLALGLSTPSIGSVQRLVYLLLQYGIQLFIVVGIIGLFGVRRRQSFQPLFVTMSIASLLLLVMSITLPFFSKTMNMSRIYHISLLFLALFFLLGGVTVSRWLSRLLPFRLPRKKGNPSHYSLITVSVLITYFLFSTGFVFEISGDAPTSISLNSTLDYPIFNQREVSAANWVIPYVDSSSPIQADRYGSLLLFEYRYPHVKSFWGGTSYVPRNTYIYLRCSNVIDGELVELPWEPGKYVDLWTSPLNNYVLSHRAIIYDNACARIYL